MKFDLRFITTLVLIVLIIVSFIFIILETLHFNSNAGKLVIEKSSSAVSKSKDLGAGDNVVIKTVGSLPSELAADTQYYRYGSLIIHILTIISGAYLVYSN